MDGPDALKGFKYKNEGDEDREAFLNEACEEANDVAYIRGHKDNEEKGDPQSNPESKLEEWDVV